VNLRARIGNLEQRVKPDRERPAILLPLFGPGDPLRPDKPIPGIVPVECWADALAPLGIADKSGVLGGMGNDTQTGGNGSRRPQDRAE
jgi:hypothetical protein